MVRSQRGFTLLELTIAMALTLVVLGAALRAMTDALTANEAVSLLADANESLQSSSTIMSRDLIDAGRRIPVGGLPLPTGDDTDDVVRPGPPEAVEAGFPEPPGVDVVTTLFAVTPGQSLGPVVNGAPTDVITIVQMDDGFPESDVDNLTRGAGTATVTIAAAANINTTPWNTVAVGDLMLLTNGTRRAVMRVTEIDGGNPRVLVFDDEDDDKRFNQTTATAGSVAQLPLGAGARVGRLRMITYWVEEQAGVPYLMRQINYGAPVQVGLGITNLQVRYDINTGGVVVTMDDPFPDYSPNQLEKAHISLAVRSDKPLRATGDYLRSDMMTQIALRSLQLRVNFEVN